MLTLSGFYSNLNHIERKKNFCVQFEMNAYQRKPRNPSHHQFYGYGSLAFPLPENIINNKSCSWEKM